MRRRRATTVRWTIGLSLTAAFVCADRAAAQRFYPDDPIAREPAPLPASDPATRNLSLLLEAVSSSLGRPGERRPPGGAIAAQGVNTLGEAPDGPWFVNRHGRTRLSAADLARGSGDAEPPSMAGPWRVLLARAQGGRPTVVVRDAAERVFMLRFDPHDAPELATGADMIGSRAFHALGYHVAETYLVAFTRDRLVAETNASSLSSIGVLRDLRADDIDRLLASVARRSDGVYRAVALRVPTEGKALIGPYQFFGTRSDDPNDLVPHEHRRDLRGLYVFSAWLNHTRIDALHTMDIVVAPDGEPPHVRHYLFDFMAMLGSGLTRAKPAWEGRDPTYAQGTTLRNMAGLGFYSPAWARADFPDLPSVGRFDAATFEPDEWAPQFDLAPFANRLPDDTFWAAKQVMAFTDDDIRTLVGTARYSDPRAERWIADCLIERRNRIGRVYFARILPLDGFTVRGGTLAFTDLAVQYGLATPRVYRVDWALYDNAAGKSSTPIGEPSLEPLVPVAASSAPAGSYLVARLQAEGLAGKTVTVYLRSQPDGLRVVGIDRAWPGRRLVDPRAVVRTTRNRYAELEPERQQLFDTYAQALNAKSGQTMTSEERFRALTPSEQTTFDGVTHALMHSALTDGQGRSLGRALDLVSGVERIAGQQAGRGGDQQFRVYVRLRPDARDTLERSREFVRSHDNTVYHAGYPHSFRLGTGVPSAQFSLADDGLSADIDVDYRTSRVPAALFNGHLTSSNSDVRAGDNARRHGRRWSGFVDWWTDLFGGVTFGDNTRTRSEPLGAAPARASAPLPPDRPLGVSIPELADAVQEFLTDWIIRRDYQGAAAFLAPAVLPCVADSLGLSPATAPDRLRRESLRLLEQSARAWGRPRRLAEAMNPVIPWARSIRVLSHAFDRDFTIVEASTELGRQYECGATPPRRFTPAGAAEYGTYYGAVLQVVTEGRSGGAMVFVWRREEGEWKLVAYQSVE